MKEFEVFTLSATHRMDDNGLWTLVGEERIDVTDLQQNFGLTVAEADNYRFWVSDADTPAARLAIVRTGPILQRATARQLTRVLERCRGFMEVSARFPLNVPYHWTPFVQDDLVAFYAASKDVFVSNPRWIAKYHPSDVVYFWALYPGEETYRRLLEHQAIDEAAIRTVRTMWPEVHAAATGLFAVTAPAAPSDSGAIVLDKPSHSYHAFRTYSQWMEPGQLSDRQRDFVLYGSSESIPVKGPAGSGKTLVLELKALHDTLELLERKSNPRVLYATHNWSMALQVDEDLRVLDEGVGLTDFITVAPLTSVIAEIRPVSPGVEVLGEDGEEGLFYQIVKLEEVLTEFLDSKFVQFKFEATKSLVELVASSTGRSPESETFRRDLLGEFTTVMGGADIQIGPDDRRKYLEQHRLPQWLELPTAIDRELVYEIYSMFLQALQEEGLLTVDQFMSSSLRWFSGYEWGPLRRTKGYDLIYVDELHLFNQQERAVLNFLGRDARQNPRIYMSLDPMQSPTGRYGNFVQDRTLGSASSEVVLNEVFRYSPQILAFVKHLTQKYPTEDLGARFNVDVSGAMSRSEDGPLPEIIDCRRSANSVLDVCFDLAFNSTDRTSRVAVAVIDQLQLNEFIGSAQRRSSKKNISIIKNREDLAVITKSRKGLVISHAEHLAGLQFDEVIIAGLGNAGDLVQWQKFIVFLSHMYLAASRAQRRLRIVLNSGEDGMPEVLQAALDNHLATRTDL